MNRLELAYANEMWTQGVCAEEAETGRGEGYVSGEGGLRLSDIPLLDLAPEGAALAEASLATSGLAQNGGAGSADDHGAGMAEHGGAVTQKNIR